MIKLNFINETKSDIKEDIFNLCIPLVEEFLPEKTSPFNDKSDINIIIVDDKKIHEINREFRKKDKPTDVISFAYLETEYVKDVFTTIGDIFISIDTANKQAIEHNHSLNKEFATLTVHGLLHLFGFDHNNDEEENEMEHYAQKILSDERLTKHF